jgi:outer membrane protein TolC
MHTYSFFRTSILAAALVAAAGADAPAQERLTLDDAIARGLRQHPSLTAARAGIAEASARVTQARSGWLPRVEFSEAWTKGNQPVYVFGSLLAQRRFTLEDFQLDRLNHPDALGNFRAAMVVEQPLFDGVRTLAAVRSASTGEELAHVGLRDAESGVRVNITQAYGQVLMAAANRRAAGSALESADADLQRVERRRDAGMATEADVLALKVHHAQIRERVIRATSQEAIARAQLNEAMGEPLDLRFELDLTPAPPADEPPLDSLEQEALDSRPDLARAAGQVRLAEQAMTTARAGFLPTAGLQGVWEGNGSTFADRASAWTVGLMFRWNVFAGFADQARLGEARAGVERARAERRRAEGLVRLDVRQAYARVKEARAREDVGRSIQAQARESHRIVRDRYEAGMASINDLLRAANAVLDADVQYTASTVDVVISAAMLERARGK